jgi:hypothetical protein
MKLSSIYRVEPRVMVPLTRFLSWLPDLRPVLAKRAILDGALGQACLDDLRPAKGIMGDEYLTVGPVAAEAIIEGYKAGKLPLKEGAKPGKTMRAEVYARSPLRPSQHQAGVSQVLT